MKRAAANEQLRHGLDKLIDSTLADFRFRYEGGGYFRDRTVPKGKHADMVHGEEVLAAFCDDLRARDKSRDEGGGK